MSQFNRQLIGLLLSLVSALSLSCSDRQRIEQTDSPETAQATRPEAPDETRTPDRDESKGEISWHEEQRAEGLKLAALTREERRAKWDLFEESLQLRDGAPIKSLLPELSKVKSVTGRFYNADNQDVDISIPASHWSKLYELFEDSEPISLGDEILMFGNIDIHTGDGKRLRIQLLSDGGNPVIYSAIAKLVDGGLPSFATTRSETDVLQFFNAFQTNENAPKLQGWYPLP
jgi:hypothetical protein